FNRTVYIKRMNFQSILSATVISDELEAALIGVILQKQN
ncbi:unnamed protein product, partial [marine sediment metagenome]